MEGSKLHNPSVLNDSREQNSNVLSREAHDKAARQILMFRKPLQMSIRMKPPYNHHIDDYLECYTIGENHTILLITQQGRQNQALTKKSSSLMARNLLKSLSWRNPVAAVEQNLCSSTRVWNEAGQRCSSVFTGVFPPWSSSSSPNTDRWDNGRRRANINLALRYSSNQSDVFWSPPTVAGFVKGRLL